MPRHQERARAMQFGIFDYIDRRDEPLSQTYEERMQLLQEADQGGFYGYHVTEHHATPLSGTPSPTVFLAAAAQRTRRIRLGALLFLLPLYQPLRLLEELCMVDHLSNGRLDIGVGRGVSPYEFASFGVELKDSGDAFDEVLEILYKGFTQERLTHHGKRFHLDDVPVAIRPVQRPHPPFWYGLRGGEHASPMPARRGMNVVTLGGQDRVAKNIARFWDMWAEAAGERRSAGILAGEPLVGVMRSMLIADSDAEAERIARPAYHRWADSLMWLWRDKGGVSPLPIPLDYDKAREAGTLVVGSPATVKRELTAQAEDCQHNYLVLQLAFGSLTHAQEMRSLRLFQAEVMPALQPIAAPHRTAAAG
jgi:alkanesulfonate monooxygenase SsuD/methylene tetrahydromethanopterin reductase-like flavin-dependent oxidoreductase (luciferase family)